MVKHNCKRLGSPVIPSVKIRIKKPKETLRNAKITDYFVVRRSDRKPLNLKKKEELDELENLIKTGDESHLLVCCFEDKGRGVVPKQAIKKGAFVVEYKGDLIERTAALKRDRLYSENGNVGCYMYYFEHAGKQYCVDATAETPYLGRLVNHSAKRPNCVTKAVEVEGEPRLILVAMRDIDPGEELLYNYGERDKEVIAANPWLVNS